MPFTLCVSMFGRNIFYKSSWIFILNSTDNDDDDDDRAPEHENVSDLMNE